MKAVARFILRPDGSGLMLGYGHKEHLGKPLKGGVVYEIQEVLDELVIREVGEPDFHPEEWSSDISSIVSTGQLARCLFTPDEYQKLSKERDNGSSEGGSSD